jgi:hypothetical protein
MQVRVNNTTEFWRNEGASQHLRVVSGVIVRENGTVYAFAVSRCAGPVPSHIAAGVDNP